MKRPKRLSAAFVKTVSRPGRYGEGRGGFGLSLLVKPRAAGGVAKSWSQRLRINGKPCNLGLGTYPIVTLAEARAKALENARAVDQGRDPRDRSRIPTFEQAAEKVVQLHEPTWKAGGGASSAKVWRSSLRTYAFPRLGSKRVHEITSGDVLRVLTRIWHTKTETARRVKGRPHLDGDEVDRRAGLPGRQSSGRCRLSGAPEERHPAGASPGAATCRGRRSPANGARVWRESGGKLAFEFQVLTAARSGQVREARWDEISGATWTVPAARPPVKGGSRCTWVERTSRGTARCGSSARRPSRPCSATSKPPASPTGRCSGGSTRAARGTAHRLGADSIRTIVRKRAAAVDGIAGQIGGHSLQVGSARELAADGASLVELQQAGGWRSPTTPAIYVRRESATRGPVARRRYGVGQ